MGKFEDRTPTYRLVVYEMHRSLISSFAQIMRQDDIQAQYVAVLRYLRASSATRGFLAQALNLSAGPGVLFTPESYSRNGRLAKWHRV